MTDKDISYLPETLVPMYLVYQQVAGGEKEDVELSYWRLIFQLPACDEDSIYIIEAKRSYKEFLLL